MTKHSYFPYTSTYSSTRQDTNKKHNIHHTPYTNILQHSKAKKTLSLTTAATQQTFPQTPTSIVSRHQATSGNNKILHTPAPHISSSEEILPASRVAQIIFTHYAPLCNIHTRHTSSLQLHPHTHHIVTPGFVDRPCRSNCTAGEMDGEPGWWTTSGNIGLPPLARVMGVGRQQQPDVILCLIIS